MSLLHVSTCFEHYVLIVRRSKLYYTASGIVTPVGARPVHGTATYRCDDLPGGAEENMQHITQDRQSMC